MIRMPLRLLLIWLILARTLLGACCSARAAAEAGADDCCHPCCEQLPCCIEEDVPPLGCMLCCACDGSVLPVPPAEPPARMGVDVHSLFAMPDEEWAGFGHRSPNVFRSPCFQMLHGDPWIERLRPIVCIWTI